MQNQSRLTNDEYLHDCHPGNLEVALLHNPALPNTRYLIWDESPWIGTRIKPPITLRNCYYFVSKLSELKLLTFCEFAS